MTSGPASFSRRDLLVLGAIGFLGQGGRLGAPRRRQPALVWHSITPDAWMVEHGGGNTTVLRERGAAVVIDVKMQAVGGVLAAEVASRIGPVGEVILTHHHGDHAGGLHGFAGRPVHAQALAAARLRSETTTAIEHAKADPARVTRGILQALATDFGWPTTPESTRIVERFVASLSDADPDRLLPTVSIDDRGTLDGRDDAFQLIHIGPGHTDNDLFVHMPGRNLLVAGDLLFDRHHPFIDTDSGATTVGWQRSLAEAIRLCDAGTRVISGHGRIVGRSALVEQSSYFDRLRDIVGRARAAGRTRAEVTALPNVFPAFGFGDLWAENLRKVFDEAVAGT